MCYALIRTLFAACAVMCCAVRSTDVIKELQGLVLDAEQMDLGDEDPRIAGKPDPTGLGAAIRMHWSATVQEVVEKRFTKVGVRGTGAGGGECQQKWA